MNLSLNGLGPSPSTQDFPIQPEPALSGKSLSSDTSRQGAGQALSYAGVGNGQVDFTPMSEKRQVQSTDPSDPQSGQSAAGGGLSAEIMSLLQRLMEMLNQMMGNSEDGKGNKSSGGGGSGGGSGAASPVSGQQAAAPQAAQGSSSPEGSGASAQTGNGSVGQTDGAGGVASTASADKAPQGMPQDLWKDCVAAGNKHGVDPFLLAAQAKQESQFGADKSGPTGADGVMQVETATRADHADDFRQKAGHDYDHSSQSDQVEMAAVIMSGLKGNEQEKLTGYNGGPNWKPGDTDSAGRVIEAEQYAQKVQQIAAELKASVA